MTDAVTARLAEWEALVPAERWALVGSVILSDEAGYVGQVSGLEWHDKGEFIAAAPTIATALLGFVREVRGQHASSQDTRDVGQIRDGVWTAYCEEDGENWPCPTEQAAQKWFGGEG